MAQPSTVAPQESGFVRGLSLFDATMVVIGVMIGSGIFIVTADMSRLIGSPGWMLMAWVLTTGPSRSAETGTDCESHC